MIEDFPPRIAHCLKNNIDVNGFSSDFFQTLTPSKFIQSLADLRETNINNITQVSTDEAQEQTFVNPGYYPHSMLAGNPHGFVSSPSILENYLEVGSNESEKTQINNNNNNNNNNNMTSNVPTQAKYEEEILASSHELMWQNAISNNILPAVNMPAYEDMLNLQRDILQLYKTSDHLVLPIYFQPFAVATQCQTEEEAAPAKETKTNSEKAKPQSSYHADSFTEEKTAVLNESQGMEKPSPETTDYDKDLLRRCQQACLDSESYIQNQFAENSQASHNDSMKCLEEAAMKLLLSSLSEKPKKRKYQRRSSPKSAEGTSLACRYCGKTFSRLFILQTHERVHSGDKPYKCAICGKCFRQSGTKLNHMRAVHAKVRPYKCEYCPKTFGHKSSLVVHRRIHTNEKPYQCETCGRKFTDRATLKKHLPTHTKEKNYKCHICGRSLTQHSNLIRHIKTLHGGNDNKLSTDLVNVA